MKDFKDKLRNTLREQRIPDIDISSIVKAGDIGKIRPTTTPELPRDRSLDEPVDDGDDATDDGGGIFEDGQVIPSTPNKPWTPPGSGGNTFHHYWPKKPPTSISPPELDNQGGNADDIVWVDGEPFIEQPPGSGFIYPAVEMPPGSGNWEISQEDGPGFPGHPSGTASVIEHNGDTYVFNVSCMCYQQMEYNSQTNGWSWVEPVNDLPDNVDVGPGPTYLYILVNGNWIQVYPPVWGDGGPQGHHADDPDSWPDCDSAYCMNQHEDGTWWHWVPGGAPGEPGDWEEGTY